MIKGENVAKYFNLEPILQERGLDGVRLDIGAGKFPVDAAQFITVDLHTSADIMAPMWSIPLPDNSVDYIYCSHALEHTPKSQVSPTLREFYRLLKPHSIMRIIVPDLTWVCHWWLEHQDTGWAMDLIYGNQTHDGEFHRTGFNVPILYKYIEDSGSWTFRSVFLDRGDVTYKEAEGFELSLEGGRKEATPRIAAHVVGRQIVIDAEKNGEE